MTYYYYFLNLSKLESKLKLPEPLKLELLKGTAIGWL